MTLTFRGFASSSSARTETSVVSTGPLRPSFEVKPLWPSVDSHA